MRTRTLPALAAVTILVLSMLHSETSRADLSTASYALSNNSRAAKEIELVEIYAGEVTSEFLYYLHTIIHLESDYDTQAVSSAGAVGIMQVMGPAVIDAAKFCGLPEPPLTSLLELEVNVVYGTCYLGLLLDKFEGDWYTTVVAYHGGYREAENLTTHRRINENTANYAIQVFYHLRNAPVSRRYTGPLPGRSTGGR